MRATVGHEKLLPLFDDYYVLKRRMNFNFGILRYNSAEFPGDRIGSLRNVEVYIPEVVIRPGFVPDLAGRMDMWAKATMIVYDNEVMAPLVGRKNIRFTPFGEYLDDYIANKMRVIDIKEVRKDYAAFQRFYFAHNSDYERQRAFTNFLGR